MGSKSGLSKIVVLAFLIFFLAAGSGYQVASWIPDPRRVQIGIKLEF